MKPFRQTRIIATLGPASGSQAMIHELFETGVNVFRLNFSHGDHAGHENAVHIIRALEKGTGRPIGIIADLQGPKLRIGTFKNGSISIGKGHAIRFDQDAAPGDETRVSLPHPEVLNVLDKDSLVFLDDGKVRARITAKGKNYVDAVIESGSKLSDKKGLNVPGAIIPLPALTDKDRKDLKAALDMGVDWIAQSFVQRAENVAEARELIQKLGGRAALMVKLEKPSALVDLEDILKLA
ncbi:MAG: pyruvate kinase, partial [Alphaproteobacteria bacterium]